MLDAEAWRACQATVNCMSSLCAWLGISAALGGGLHCYAVSSRGGSMQTASVKWIGEEKFAAISPSGHAMVFDSDRESNKGPGPMEILLMALGACTATDVVIVLQKKRQKLGSLEVICSGDRAANPPSVWTKLEVLYRLRGELDEAAVKHAIPSNTSPH